MLSTDEAEKIVQKGISKERLDQLIGGSSSMPAFNLGESIYKTAECEAKRLEGKNAPMDEIYDRVNFYYNLLWTIEDDAARHDFPAKTLEALDDWAQKLEELCMKYFIPPKSFEEEDIYKHRDFRPQNIMPGVGKQRVKVVAGVHGDTKRLKKYFSSIDFSKLKFKDCDILDPQKEEEEILKKAEEIFKYLSNKDPA